jgi:heavy metal-binding protein
MTKTYLLIAMFASLLFAVPPSNAAHQDHAHRRAAKVRKRIRKQAANYVCPMHPDMRSKSRGECAKCGMELVKERRSKDRAVVLFR